MSLAEVGAARIGVQRATWFYPSSTQNKFYPVDALLAYHLEEAYEEIKPYAASYADELKSAIEIGSEGEAKLKHNMMEVGVDVIYQSADSAKIYARNLPSRLSKTFLTSFLRDKAHSGGGSKRSQCALADQLTRELQSPCVSRVRYGSQAHEQKQGNKG